MIVVGTEFCRFYLLSSKVSNRHGHFVNKVITSTRTRKGKTSICEGFARALKSIETKIYVIVL